MKATHTTVRRGDGDFKTRQVVKVNIKTGQDLKDMHTAERQTDIKTELTNVQTSILKGIHNDEKDGQMEREREASRQNC